MNDRVQPVGIRLDLDKKVILDSVYNTFVDAAIQKQVHQIWEVVTHERGAVSG